MVTLAETSQKEECFIEQAFSQELPAIPGFGFNGCNCPSHPFFSTFFSKDLQTIENDIFDILKQRTDRIYFVNGVQRVSELGSFKTLNIFMLGCLSFFLPFKVQIWKDSISEHVPVNMWQINLTAFNQGRKEIQNVPL